MSTKFWSNSFFKVLLSASAVASLCLATSISTAQTSDPAEPGSTELPVESDEAVEDVTEGTETEPEATETPIDGMETEPEATETPIDGMETGTESQSIPPEKVGINGEYDEAGLAKRVAAAFDEDPTFSDVDTVYVAQEGSTVVLKGQVPDQSLLEQMETLIMEVDGATAVDASQVTVLQ